MHGGLSKKALVFLNLIETDLLAGRKAELPYVESNQLKIGIQLVRENDGVFHRVIVMEGGYVLAAKTFLYLEIFLRSGQGHHGQKLEWPSLLWLEKEMDGLVPRTHHQS